MDPHTYTVLARHMAETGLWFDPSYLPSIFHRFREHLPFGIWPWAAAVRAFGEDALAPLALLASIASLAIMLVQGARVFGRSAALLGVLVLSATDSFFQTAGQVRLDNVLLVLTTASTIPLWQPIRLPRSRWIGAGALTSLAVLVKGPFGLLPLVATALGRAVTLRSVREVLVGGLAGVAAVLPATIFLAQDALLGEGTWWRGYVLGQIYASARGLRVDGDPGLVPLQSLIGRFWPGLPFALYGVVIGIRDVVRRRPTASAIVAVHTILGLALLSLPARKLPHHNLVLYPALALLAGTVIAPLVRRLLASDSLRRGAVAALIALAAATTVASAAGLGASLTRTTCVIPPGLAASLPRGSDVLVVAPEKDWRAMAALGAEYDVNAWPTQSLTDENAARFALVRSDMRLDPNPAWCEREADGNWTLWARDADGHR